MDTHLSTRFGAPPNAREPNDGGPNDTPGERTGVRDPMPKALVFAWVIEGFAVALGLVLAIYAGLEGGANNPGAFVIATLPFLALSAIELTKIPLVALLFRVRSRALKALGAVALLAVTVATFENFVFGFERGFNERLTQIAEYEGRLRANDADAAAIRARLAALDEERTAAEREVARLTEERGGIQREAREDIVGADQRPRLEEIAAERRRVDEARRDLIARRDAELAADRARCGRRPAPDQPPIPCRAGQIDARYAALLRDNASGGDALGAEADRLRREFRDSRAQSLERRDADIARAEARIAEVTANADRLRRAAEETRAALAATAEARLPLERRHAEMLGKSQIHRLAEGLFGGREQSQVEAMKRFFVLSLSAIVALIGTVIAILHYAARTQRAEAPGPVGPHGVPAARRPVLRNTLRAWIVGRRRRRNRAVVREVIKEVPVDRLKIVYLPLDAPEDDLAGSRRDNIRPAT